MIYREPSTALQNAQPPTTIIHSSLDEYVYSISSFAARKKKKKKNIINVIVIS